MNKIILATILSVILLTVTFTSVSGIDSNYDNDFSYIQLTSNETLLFDSDNENIIRVSVTIKNNEGKNDPTSGRLYYDNTFSENVYGSDIIGSAGCRTLDSDEIGNENVQVYCFEVPKKQVSNFSFDVYSTCYLSWYVCNPSQKINIKNPISMNFQEFVYERVYGKIKNLSLQLIDVELITQPRFNILKINFDATNIGNELVYYESDHAVALGADLSVYSITDYDMTNLGYDSDQCSPNDIYLNPKLTESYSYCFEVPKNEYAFDLVIRQLDSDYTCDSIGKCYLYTLHISNPRLNKSVQHNSNESELEKSTPDSNSAESEINSISCGAGTVLDENTNTCVLDHSVQNEPKQTNNVPEPEPKESELAPFVDPNRDPQSYIDRYNNEPEYREWFDTNYPDMTIYEAVGLQEPTPELVPTSQCQEGEEWVESSGICMNQEPTPEPELTCGQGTQLVNGICQIANPQSSSESGGCLIATATYGSELAPQVQQLRELRDNSLLQTASGISFMSGFNQFYYTFSPTVADWERESPIFRETVKLTITPMLSTLSILNYADIHSEQQMLGYGIGIILLNAGIYFGIPAVLIFVIRKKF